MSKCIICGKTSDNGIRLGDSFICAECEQLMTRAIPGTAEYDALLDALRNIKLPAALSMPQSEQDDGIVETYIVASVAELLAYVGLSRLGSDDAQTHPEFESGRAGAGRTGARCGMGGQGDLDIDDMADLSSLAKLADLVRNADLDDLDDIAEFDSQADDDTDDGDAGSGEDDADGE